MKFRDLLTEIDALNQEVQKVRPILTPALLQQIKGYYRIGLTYSSNALEGNTLTETETKIVLEDGLTVAGKPLRDHYEAAGHGEAFNVMWDLSQSNRIEEANILALHHLFYYRIDPDNAGHYRQVPVIITGTDYVPPPAQEVPHLMKTFVQSLDDSRKHLHPVEFAARVHKEIVDIHPFVDGNGRTARLVMNLALLQTGHVVTHIPPIKRNGYLSVIKGYQTGSQPYEAFVQFLSEMVLQATKDYLRLLNSIAK